MHNPHIRLTNIQNMFHEFSSERMVDGAGSLTFEVRNSSSSTHSAAFVSQSKKVIVQYSSISLIFEISKVSSHLSFIDIPHLLKRTRLFGVVSHPAVVKLSTDIILVRLRIAKLVKLFLFSDGMSVLFCCDTLELSGYDVPESLFHDASKLLRHSMIVLLWWDVLVFLW